MRTRRHLAPNAPDAFSIDTSATFGNLLTKMLNNFGAVVVAIAGISLVIGGIVIMNIMLVSVTERTREIGIRRAIGAKKRNIMLQFIMEAVVLCEVGGAVGVVLGILGGNVLALILKLPPAVPIDWVVMGLAICSVVGIIFGTYPAWKAATLDPIESLRYE